ncbi:MAG TPA: T9SS type A sorting domain-containing protein, partial [Steroidobacteraceae bacterium]|nr:T9SS type A sorting domain-containing protein [Steroidobacteraceae bacterium]
ITDPFTVDPIAPHSSSIVTTTFTPQRPRQYIDSLVVTADAPEATKSVVLQGKGVFEPFGYPEITYSLPNIWARVGDIVDIPIEIGGPQYNLVAIDSFYIDITFDSTVIYIRSVKPGTVTAGNTLLLTQLSHSKIRVSNIKGDTLSRLGGTLCILRAEALLGPNDSTGLIIAASDPTNTAILQSSSGSFVVTDCGNYRGGILFKGNYSISPSTPNPTNGILTIPYELGIAAHVRIDLFDQLGRRVKTLLDADRGFGKHELVANISDLPSGGYYYTIESLEYHASQNLQLLK